MAEWTKIVYWVFDSPEPRAVFEKREVKAIKKSIWAVDAWLEEQHLTSRIRTLPHYRFDVVNDFLLDFFDGFDGPVKVVKQTVFDLKIKDQILTEVLNQGGEGIMLRDAFSFWYAVRSKCLLKLKGLQDSEGTVVGYVWGRETDKGSKLLGLMGALVLEFEGKRFELSGFTDAERAVIDISTGNPVERESVRDQAGSIIDSVRYRVPCFPLGSKVTFQYRELTQDGIPKEARYWRKREEE